MKIMLVVTLSLVIAVSLMSSLAFAADNRNILKEGLLGAATGAIASEASGGKAGKGALVGAGVNVIGGALMDSLSGQPAQQVDEEYGSSQQVYQKGFQDGFEQGRRAGYKEGYKEGVAEGR